MNTTTSDPLRTYTAEEEQTLTLNLFSIAVEVHSGGLRSRKPNLDLLRELHHRLFDGVRDHAGQIRRPGYGTETLLFGPNRSAPNRAVPDLLLDLFADFHRRLEALEKQTNETGYENEAMSLAARIHADVIRIHPFEDGSGRTGRLLFNWILVRLGLRPIAFEATKEEYCDCLNHYYRTGDLTPLVDLSIRLYPAT